MDDNQHKAWLMIWASAAVCAAHVSGYVESIRVLRCLNDIECRAPADLPHHQHSGAPMPVWMASAVGSSSTRAALPPGVHSNLVGQMTWYDQDYVAASLAIQSSTQIFRNAALLDLPST